MKNFEIKDNSISFFPWPVFKILANAGLVLFVLGLIPYLIVGIKEPRLLLWLPFKLLPLALFYVTCYYFGTKEIIADKYEKKVFVKTLTGKKPIADFADIEQVARIHSVGGASRGDFFELALKGNLYGKGIRLAGASPGTKRLQDLENIAIPFLQSILK